MKTKELTPEQKLERIHRDVEIDPEYFTQWERTFISDRMAFQKIGSSHTDAQIKQINRIYEKAQKR